MTPSEPRVLVIGAGPAGLAAAVAAGQAGVRVLLVDEAGGPGGQYLGGKQVGQRFQTPAERDGAGLIACVQELCRAGRIEVRWGATVWSLEAGLTASLFQHVPGQSPRAERVRAEAVVLATGARETVAPFPGWTLPGVMTVGAAQLLAKRHGVIPATSGNPARLSRPRVLVAGSGLLLLPAAAWLAESGAQVIGVLETAQPSLTWLGKIGGLGAASRLTPSLWERRDETRHYLSILRRHHIPYRFGRAVVAGRTSTTGYLEAADVARLDGEGCPVGGTTETWPVDLLCIGSGLVANVELAHLAGADLVCDPALGGWVVAVDRASRVRSTLPGLFVAGESMGILGASASLLSGRIAGMSAAAHLGRLPEATLQGEITRTAAQRRRHLRFGAAVNLLFGAPPSLYRAIPDETPVCRCEDVTAGQVRAAIAAGVRSLDGLKAAMRVGQGLCQGRTCGPILSRMLAAEASAPPDVSGRFRPRPPVKPVPLAAMAGLLGQDEGALLQEGR